MKIICLLIAFALSFFAARSMAAAPETKVIKADTPEKFAVMVESVRDQMAPGKRYEFLNSFNRRSVNHSLDIMARMLQRTGSVDAMSQEDKTKLFSLQEKVNGILVQNADDRMVCTHSAPTGSHIPMTDCRTVRELELRRAEARRKQKEMEDSQRGFIH